MKKDINRLRAQAEKARRLAGLSSDAMARRELMAFANECDAKAARIETEERTAED